MFALIYLAKTKEVKFINGTGYAPQGRDHRLLQRARRHARRRRRCRLRCPARSAAPRWRWRSTGPRPLADVLAPAIEVAEQGYPITENLARGLDGGKGKLGKFPSTTKIWFRDGKPLVMGDVVKNPDLAKTLRAIATQGPAGFYTGPVAKALVAGMRAHGGIISEEDLAQLQAVRGRADPRQLPRLRGLRVPAQLAGPHHAAGAEPPRGLQPALHGPQQRALPARRHRVDQAGLRRPQPVRRPTRPSRRTSRCASCCRRSTRPSGGRSIDPNRAIVGEAPYGDPRGGTTTTAGRQAAYAAPQRVPGVVNPYDPDKVLNLTTYLTVVDKDHNMVSLTSSLLSGFGSGLVARGHRRDDERPDEVLLPRPEGRQLAAAAASACARPSTRRWR